MWCNTMCIRGFRLISSSGPGIAQPEGMGCFRRSDQGGFSVLELLIVVAITGVLAAIAGAQIAAMQPSFKADGGMRQILSQINQARELSITQRRYMRVTFTAPNLVQVVREDTTNTTTTLYSARLEGGVQFVLYSGVPDTPDAFGKAAAIDFGTAVTVKFSPDGFLVNQDGQTTNGTVFLAIPQLSRSVRAVTVLGATGRVRGYRWDSRAWKVV
jgi:prepilin-type N-terminal cleavage/methylation domain-containing protein